ncbi:phosphohistidine phosphatase [Murinocardiopsis flavida]|uniref:Phosphohistidine phosphatase n=1 Tax=Murinocardiopsis flavida TaxID=645275 RepID=A0A2P8DQG7_9ACTN|nr:histidine phosphatase family protein [Murinocardiopsis flavida]PSK99434.1 phosphohistidine phosphatase [Murinocardiopsis flavida]
MTRRLVVLRHAQAELGVGRPDHERALTGTGRSQAAEAGASLARAGLVPDHVICSSARRTRQTLDLALGELPATPSVDYSDAAYSAGVDDIFALVSAVDPDVSTLLVVGHNPTVAQLAAAFTGDGTLLAFPPAAAAVAELDVEWLYAAPGTGTGRLLG